MRLIGLLISVSVATGLAGAADARPAVAQAPPAAPTPAPPKATPDSPIDSDRADAIPDLGPVALTNARIGGSPRDPAALNKAIAVGDVDYVRRNGGTAQDTAAALRIATLTDPGAAREVEDLMRLGDGDRLVFGGVGEGGDASDRPALIRLGPDGAPTMVVSLDLRTVHRINPKR